MNIAFVSGASGNLGSAVAQKFLSEGFTVIGTVNKRSLDEQANDRLHLLSADLTDFNNANEVVRYTSEKFGVPDVTVLTVGGYAGHKITDSTSAEIESQYKLNFLTTYNLAQPFFKRMMERGAGRIYLTGARSARDMNQSKGAAAYGLSKSLVFRLHELLNAEGSSKNIQSTIIVPSIIDTPQNRQSMPGSDFTKWTKPGEIAEAVYKHYINNSHESSLEF